jgi:co-chaperonin GroES (HSP10)
MKEGIKLFRNYIAIEAELTTKSGIVLKFSDGKKGYELPLHVKVAFTSSDAEERLGIIEGNYVTLRGTAQPYMQIPYNGKPYNIYDGADVLAMYTPEQVEKENKFVKDDADAKNLQEFGKKLSQGVSDTLDPTTQQILDKLN